MYPEREDNRMNTMFSNALHRRWNFLGRSIASRCAILAAVIVTFNLFLLPYALAYPPDNSKPSGQVTDADRDVVIKVRQANLWEGPVSAQVMARTRNPKVKAIAAQLAKDHHSLDAATVDVAAKLGISLPDQPMAIQQDWVRQILAAPPDESDKIYVELARAAHGSVLPVIAQARSATQNDVVRSFAQVGLETVSRHMMLLESTGLATSDSLYVPAVGSGSASYLQNSPSSGNLMIGIAIGGLAALVTLVIVRVGGKPSANRP